MEDGKCESVVCGVWFLVSGGWNFGSGSGSESTEPVTQLVLGSTVADNMIIMSFLIIILFVFKGPWASSCTFEVPKPMPEG